MVPSISLDYNNLLFLLILLLLLLQAPLYPATGGSWSLLLKNVGISAMHMQLLPNDRVVIYDLTDFGTSNISLPHTKCLPNSTDCTAHSVECDITFNTVRPLSVLTNFWCSSGSLMADGRLVQTGGYNNGYRVVRVYESCDMLDNLDGSSCFRLWQEMTGNASPSTVREQGNITLQCPKLTETNYSSWSILVETVLRAHGLWKTVTGEDEDEKRNYTTKAIIYPTLSEDVLLQVAKYKNAEEVWESIRIRYLGTDRVQKARLQTLRGDLERLKMKDNETIDDFSGKLGAIVEKFKSLGSCLDEEMAVRKFLNSVPMKYLPIVASIEQYSDLETMSLEEVVGRLKAYEDRLKIHDEKEEERDQLMMASEQWHGESGGRGRGRGRNYERGGRGRGRGRGRGEKSEFRCYECGDFGHFAYEVRVFEVLNFHDTCDWKEIGKGLNRHRWYATNHILPGGGRQIIIGGHDAFSYEFYPKISSSDKAFNLPFLSETNNRKIENNLYPFVFLTPEGHLFMFANNRAILLDYTKNKVLKTYPTIPGGHPRNYPSTGSAVLLPLKMKNGSVISFGVLVCGGAPKGAFLNAQKGKFNGALDSCGRIKITDPNPQWEMDTMPLARVMGDMVLLPNGHVLIINGASAGTGGWEYGRNPVLSPVVYRPKNPVGSRFEVQHPSTIPRMYHSTAILVRDGRVLIGGSNPHQRYVFKNVLYPTELSLEAFSPSYLESSSSKMRPKIISPKSKTDVSYGDRVIIRFALTGPLDPNSVTVTLVSPAFNTHSFSMNQRLLLLERTNFTKGVGNSSYKVHVTAPPSGNIAPAGNYLLFVVHREIPSPGIWINMH
ncbi:hypothetical protein LXL04_008886 [Taraxacum kok-saghyz]